MEKCVLTVAGQETNEACGTDQLYIGMDVLINGGIYTMGLLWQKNAQEEVWVFLLVDERKKFNEENQTVML